MASIAEVVDYTIMERDHASVPLNLDSVIAAVVQPGRETSRFQSIRSQPEILSDSTPKRNPEWAGASERAKPQQLNTRSGAGSELELHDFALMELLKENGDALNGVRKSPRRR